MPELPDLLYAKTLLDRTVRGRTVREVRVLQPVVLRNAIDRPVGESLATNVIQEITLRGPFIRLGLSNNIEVIINLMLAGRLQHQRTGERAEGYVCLTVTLDDGTQLNICDAKKMAKVYVVRAGEYGDIPKYTAQGIDILSPGFSPEAFRTLAHAHARRQVRVFINDQTALSTIGNAYADEILFEARIHPKTFVGRLAGDELDRLHQAIATVITWGIQQVERAGQPMHVKVRDHMKIRNRKGNPCPRCGGTIRREGVRGHDVFFCPTCQPASRVHFIDWRESSGGKSGSGRH